MLRKETVTPGTLGVLKNLMKDNLLDDFFLVGGTALSLQIGHRISIDIDLFSKKPFDGDYLFEYLDKNLGFKLDYLRKNTLKGIIDNVQVDFITHDYPLVDDLQVIEGIRIAGLKDIAAMKFNAIEGNGTRLKDFIDIAFLSSYLSLNEMFSAYESKYPSRNIFSIIKALEYHTDINFEEPINLMNGSFKWNAIERRLGEIVKNPDKVFQN